MHNQWDNFQIYFASHCDSQTKSLRKYARMSQDYAANIQSRVETLHMYEPLKVFKRKMQEHNMYGDFTELEEQKACHFR